MTPEALDLLNQLPEAYVCWKDKNSCFLGCNDNFARLVGKSKDEIVGCIDREIKHTRDDLEVLKTLKPKLGMKEWIQNKDGERVSILTNKGLLRSEDGEVMGILVVFFLSSNLEKGQ